jgi:flagellar motor switch protein FliN/FliY
MPQDPVPPEAVRPESHAALWLAEEWGRQITRALEPMTGESVRITFAPRPPAPLEIDTAQQEVLWWEQPLSLSPDSIIWVGAAAPSWGGIGNRVLRSAGVDDATAEDVRRTYLEVVNQSLSGVASAVSARARQEISCLDGRTAPPSAASGASAYAFEITLDEQPFPLLAVFAASVANLSDTPVQVPARAASLERGRNTGPAQKASSPGSLDLLLDVELPVSVSFGRAQLMLKDVIKLTTGSIVELNRALSEPVEVIVNNCVIARGEVVVVEGNYGIRIKQVISRQERLRTLY